MVLASRHIALKSINIGCYKLQNENDNASERAADKLVKRGREVNGADHTNSLEGDTLTSNLVSETAHSNTDISVACHYAISSSRRKI